MTNNPIKKANIFSSKPQTHANRPKAVRTNTTSYPKKHQVQSTKGNTITKAKKYQTSLLAQTVSAAKNGITEKLPRSSPSMPLNIQVHNGGNQNKSTGRRQKKKISELAEEIMNQMSANEEDLLRLEKSVSTLEIQLETFTLAKEKFRFDGSR